MIFEIALRNGWGLAMRMRVAILAAMMLEGVAAQAADFTGVARVIDGNTLVIDATKIRLERIDAP